MSAATDPVIEIFNEALKLAPAERLVFLDSACGEEETLRPQVDDLLRAYESAGVFLEDPVVLFPVHEGPGPGAAVGEQAGDRVGKYRLLEQIGEGGCGVVFMAEQQEPVRRQVALKVVKPGMDTRSVIAQFESERQALAMMEHPHIAQVFDAGATATGRPYFVMELVRGEKITDYCNHRSMALKERLGLFVQVCHAVQHAHQKGIIHRDIKPSNILVSTSGEGEPLPKVIDFGIAKAITGQRLTDKTLFTAREMLIGTPAYMSPEQADLKNLDVDTRTDIYSLGVLLYELLTGAMPFEIRELFKAGLDEVRRDILDKQPVRPSVRLKGMAGEELAVASQERQLEPTRLVRALRGDLDWIVMKALEKDRSRRYPTANALALDVQRHLADEAVTARPPSTLYQVGKLVARNRLLVGGLAVIALLLVSSVAVMSVLLARERAAHRQAEKEKRTARVEAAKSEQVSGFLSKMLGSVSPSVAMGKDISVLSDLLARTDQEISKDLVGQPEVEATVRITLSDAYRALGDFRSSERMLRRVLEIHQAAQIPDREMIAVVTAQLGYALFSQGRDRDEEAERVLLSARDQWRVLGAGETRGGILAVEYLAMLCSRQGRSAEAEPLMRQVYAWRKNNMERGAPDLVNAQANLAVLAHDAGKYAEAEQLFREVLEAKERVYGKDRPELITTLRNLASSVFDGEGRDDEARAILARAVDLCRKRLNPRHPERLAAIVRLADMHLMGQGFADAEILYREAIEGGGLGDPSGATALRGLVEALQGQKKDAEVEPLLNGVLGSGDSKSPAVATALEMRAELLARACRWKEAAGDAARLVAMEPAECEHYHRLAPLLVAAGDDEAYRKLCPEILSRFAATTDGRIADRMAKDCLICPGAVADLPAVQRMAALALERGGKDGALPFFQVCKALADYRNGDFSAAAELAGKVGTSSFKEAEIEALAVRAMASQRMSQPEEARTLLARGAWLFEKGLPRSGENLGGNWRDWIIARELLQEARALVEGEGP